MALYRVPELNHRYAHAMETTLRSAIERSNFSAFTDMLRMEVDPQDGLDRDVLASCWLLSSRSIPKIWIRETHFGALHPSPQQLSTYTVWMTESNDSYVGQTIHHEASHPLVDEAMFWSPHGPFPVLDAYCEVIGLNPGSYVALARAIDLFDPKLTRTLSNYGYDTMTERWAATRKAPASLSTIEHYDTFYGFDAFADTPEGDIARSLAVVLTKTQTHDYAHSACIDRSKHRCNGLVAGAPFERQPSR